ncbi:MAG: substrate-binding periplasmic protein, partial [Pseudomonas sp.]
MRVPSRWLISLALLFSGALVAGERLRMVADTWPPFTDARLPNNGLASELVASALHRAGYSTEYVEVPWARALRGLELGDYDLIIGAWHEAERTRYGVFSEPYLVNRIRFLQRKGGKIAFKRLEDLRPYSIAVARGYAYDARFDRDQSLKKEEVTVFEMGA